MKAALLLRERLTISETVFVEMVVWKVPKPLAGSAHAFKYRLSLVSEGTCVLRFDNEAGKGDHKHFGEREAPYRFDGPEKLQTDFWADVERWRRKR